MKYLYLEPEVAGGAGPNTIMDRTVHPPLVSELHFEFDVWLGDDLVEGFPCWMATQPAAMKILASGLTGVSAAPVEISTSGLFEQLYPVRRLPKFAWLKITGQPGHDDFGVPKSHAVTGKERPAAARRFRLVVSERALKVLQTLNIEHAKVSPFPD